MCRGRRLKTKPPSRRKRGRPQGRFMDVEKEDRQRVGMTEEVEADPPLWRPLKGAAERKESKERRKE